MDLDGDEIDILVQKRKDKSVGMLFFKRLLISEGATPLEIVTDKLASYPVAQRELLNTLLCNRKSPQKNNSVHT